MAPFLSFTAEEAWPILAGGPQRRAVTTSIFTQTYARVDAPDAGQLGKWGRLREIRDVVNKEIEAVRAAGALGSSLQAAVRIAAPAEDRALLAGLGEDLRFVLITSAAEVVEGEALAVAVTPREAPKCERCWHYREDVGVDPAHPTLCGRCVANLFGDGEARRVA
jgi:isoleucyl-tRNA synthetase